MKTLILLIGLTLGALQADNIVTYDTRTVATETIGTNHPTQDLY
ncbi:MAG: hypothetical protein WC274_00060 [Sulfurimonas sp.]|jgi:hypothetical protein|nr:hypothetical protein [Sulfurimonas sp.]HUH42459.1 hypothetical protein [Sulfurimonas sp.]